MNHHVEQGLPCSPYRSGWGELNDASVAAPAWKEMLATKLPAKEPKGSQCAVPTEPHVERTLSLFYWNTGNVLRVDEAMAMTIMRCR
ncbi:hypothetical protein DIPPA_16741 [Diplonema papillatum]|nr:hypothetical protein DIPPA_16741 [Diplonema papillatum]